MSKFCIFLLFSFLPLSLFSEDLRVRIEIETHDEVYILHDLGIPIENLHPDFVETHLSLKEIEKLENLGYRVAIIPPVQPKGGYHDYDALTAKLKSIAGDYPEITRLVSIGQSVEGKEIWALKITDNPDSQEVEAEVRIASTIHGDEPPGTEIILRMIDSLTQVYSTDTAITNLIDTREIWSVPMLNPDGNAHVSRYNANGIDLNRNFPVPDGSIGQDSTYKLETETEAMIDWSDTMSFVLSCMYHTGALVVNYQWDYDSLPAPDDDLIREISLGYARLNLPMYNSTVFDSGVVRGWNWYPVYGSLQDWSYHETSCIDLTIEISNDYWPDTTYLDNVWEDNREGILYLIKRAGTGLCGVVTDYLSGAPLFATVSVVGIDKPIHTDPAVGDYHRMLLNSIYTVEVSADGYTTKTIPDVTVDFNGLTTLNVRLFETKIVCLKGKVRDKKNGEPLYAEIKLVGDESDSIETDPLTGEYSLQIYQGLYDVEISSTGYETLRVDSLLITGTTEADFELNPLQEEKPVSLFLSVYPNPFNSSAVIRLECIDHVDAAVTRSQHSIRIYDASGRIIRTLPITDCLSPITEVVWDGRDGRNRKVRSGCYYLLLEVEGESLCWKVVVCR